MAVSGKDSFIPNFFDRYQDRFPAVGCDVPTASLTDVHVRAIRLLAALNWPIHRIKRRLHLPQKWDTVAKAATGRTWSHLPNAVGKIRTVKNIAPPSKAARAALLKLTPETALTIKRMRLCGATITVIANAVGVSRSSVHKVIRNGEHYASQT